MYDDYGLNPLAIFKKIKQVEPLLISILKSAESGIKNKDKEISEASDQNIKYLFAKITDTVVEIIKKQPESTRNMVGMIMGDFSKAKLSVTANIMMKGFGKAANYVNDTPGLSSLKNWMRQKDENGDVIKSTLKKGVKIPKKYQ